MSTIINRQWLLARRPQGLVKVSDFELVEAECPTPDLAKGEILVRNVMISFEPAMRGWMDDVRSYLPPVRLGDPMRAFTVARVVRSENPAYPTGALVSGMFGWQEYAIGNQAGGMPPALLPPDVAPELVLGGIGGSSLTAYFGLLDIGRPKAGETVLVSAAAGAVGSAAVQIAQLQGCDVIAVAGGEEKRRWLREICGVTKVIDYKSTDLGLKLGEYAPGGIDVFFDNVGGDQLELAIDHIADHGRIVLCGAIATYNDERPRPGPRNMTNLITRRVRMEGFIMMDYMDRMDEARNQLLAWAQQGKLKFRNDIASGIENVPETLLRLFRGENKGKQLLRLSE